jgi:hypothetical protein
MGIPATRVGQAKERFLKSQRFVYNSQQDRWQHYSGVEVLPDEVWGKPEESTSQFAFRISRRILV